jgi:ABC-type glycerol-3-phosphate transport system substrate-binding protein
MLVMRLILIYLSLILVLSACADYGTSGQTNVPATLPPSVSTVGTPTAIPAIPLTPLTTETPISPLTLSLWWPDTLAPTDRVEVTETLNQQINSFTEQLEETLEINFRIKRYTNEQGGLMPTLRTAHGVATGALPDLTLIRRSDLLLAVDAGLIYPMDGLVNPFVIGNLYPVALELGQVGDHLYGLPYMLDIQHMIYTQDALDTIEGTVQTSFEAVLASDLSLIMPTRRTLGLNLTFYAQYIHALNHANDGSILPVNQNALETVLSFYESAYQEGVMDSSLLEYVSINDYASFVLNDDRFDIALITSTMYLTQRYNGRDDIHAFSIPTHDGDATGILNGWMWVVTTPNPERQALVGDFINWMMDVNRQAEFADITRTLPSQQPALQLTHADYVPIDTYHAILSNAVVILPDGFSNLTARAIQSALISVLSGEATALEAAQSVVEQVDSGL